MIQLPIINNKRECGECTKCCEGWLSAKILNKIISPGNPCDYIKNNSCSIYEDRPIRPCRTFNCSWILTDLPDEFYPALTGVIPMPNVIEKTKYIFLVNAPNYPSESLIKWFTNKDYNLLYFNINDKPVYSGSISFIESIENNLDNIIKYHNELSSYYIK
jgi:hypothetical protein